MVPDDVVVLRMVWHPFHFDEDGELLATAFEKNDLLAFPDDNGDPRYVSVDDISLISQMSVDWRVAWQQRDGRAERNKRFNPKFVQFTAERLRQCRCVDDRQMFDLTREPMAENEDGPGSPENPAHCGVWTLRAERYSHLSAKQQKQAVMRMRAQLMKAVDAVRQYEDVFRDAA